MSSVEFWPTLATNPTGLADNTNQNFKHIIRQTSTFLMEHIKAAVTFNTISGSSYKFYRDSMDNRHCHHHASGNRIHMFIIRVLTTNKFAVHFNCVRSYLSGCGNPSGRSSCTTTARGSLKIQDAKKWPKIAIWEPSHKFVRLYLRNLGMCGQSEKKTY